MILESMSNVALVETIHPLFKKAFDYIQSNDMMNVAPGKIVLEEDKLFIIVSESNGKNLEDAVIESHNKFIDIQIPIVGTEIMGWMPIVACAQPKDSYDAERDLTFFDDIPSVYVPVECGNFIVFFPSDGHAPGIGDGFIKKLVVKVAVL